jgi:pSer/pThr/pTyr-binding forkhead associated (FHA) protein
MNPKLIIVEGEATQDEIQVRLPMTIGRVQGNGLVISHPLVSRTHCELVRRDDWLWVRDLGSANGTFIGEQRVEGEAVLKPGDRLTVGPLTFVAVYQQQGLIPPRTASKLDAQKVIQDRKGDSAIGASGPPPGATATPPSPPGSKAGPTVAAGPAAKPAAPLVAAKNGKSGEAPSATKPVVTNTIASAPLPAAANARPAAAAGAPSGDDPFAAWASQSEPPKFDDAVLKGPPSPGSPEAVAELASALEALAEGLFDDLEDDEELSDDGPPSDDSDVLASEIAPAEDDPGTTAIVRGSDLHKTIAGPVVIEHQPLEEEAEEGDAVAALPEEDDGQPQQSDVVLFHLIHQADRLQRRMLENYQQAVITAEMVSRLQQAQLDQLRHEMDRLHELTRFLQQAIISQHPEMKRVPEHEESLNAIPELPAAADAPAPELTIEHVQHTLRQRMTAEEQDETRHWEAVRKFFKSNGLG